MAKRTALYDNHVAHGGKIVEFAGYELPVQYTAGLMNEHLAVRNKVGLFDVSHMGELIVKGENAEEALNAIVTNDVRGMYDGQVRYSVLPNEQGGAIDDILIYRINGQCYFIVVNASNADKDAAWISSHLPKGVHFENISNTVSQVALQGPLAETVLKKVAAEEFIPKKYYSFIKKADVKGIKCLISRTGYTGEKGYELYCANADVPALFELLLKEGQEEGILPCGLGARDTLRLEAGMPLYGHELGEDIPVNEVDLGFAIKMGKDDFIGKKALEAHAPEYARVGAKVVDRGIAREHSPVYSGNELVGMVTSGTHAPYVGYPIAMLRIKKEYLDKPLEADVRGRRLKLEIIPIPFFKK
ncbi:MAG: glycine cleavage system aminomethyltransferase GcvT [Clostridiales bacterium]|nr:glycine cleavage system aminomethyltransferase GcvT [Clostridiales bacterium]